MKEQIEQYVRNVKERYESCRDNEAATKAALIAPLLDVLGYDMADPNECKPEYKVDFGERRSVRAGGSGVLRQWFPGILG